MFSYGKQPIWIPYPLSFLNQNGVYMDFSYLQEAFPEKMKEYQKSVSKEVDRYDYPGSVIYDEYPDKLTLYRMAVDITKKLENEMDAIEDILNQTETNQSQGPCTLLELIQVLLMIEIYSRRKDK